MSLPDRLLCTLGEAMFVSPSLKSLILALPDGAAPARRAQIEAVAGAVVFNAWLCRGEDALELLRRADEATEQTFHLFPRDLDLTVDGPDAVAFARSGALGVAARLGFSPGRRAAIGRALEELAQAMASGGGGRLCLDVVLEEPRGFVATARVESASAEVRARVLGSVERHANAFAEASRPGEPLLVRAEFVAAPPRAGAPPQRLVPGRRSVKAIPPTDRVRWTRTSR